jgi:hypothetical protein
METHQPVDIGSGAKAAAISGSQPTAEPSERSRPTGRKPGRRAVKLSQAETLEILTDAIINTHNSGTVIQIVPEGKDVHIILQCVRISDEQVLCPVVD